MEVLVGHLKIFPCVVELLLIYVDTKVGEKNYA